MRLGLAARGGPDFPVAAFAALLQPRADAARDALKHAVDVAEAARLLPMEPDDKRREAFVNAYAALIEADRKITAVGDIAATREQAEAQGILEQWQSLTNLVGMVLSGNADDGVIRPESVSATKGAAQTTKAVSTIAAAAKPVFAGIAPNNLFDDPIAPLIAAAPERAWHGVYDKTHGFGSFGNTDIAIVMESLASFTVKGVRNDTSRVTGAAFNSINLMVSLAATSMGVPTGGLRTLALGDEAEQSAQAAAAAHSPTTAIDAADTATSAARAVSLQQRIAAVNILSAITRERDALTNAATDAAAVTARKDAVDRIRDTIEGNAAALTASRTPAKDAAAKS